METLTAGSALLEDIIAHPEDDGLRLIYADWLEDAGWAERAELIRGQMSGDVRPARFVIHHWTDSDGDRYYPTTGGDVDGRRGASVPHVEWMRRAMIGTADRAESLPRGLFAGLDLDFSRGFIATIRCTLAAWLEHGPDLVRQHPLTRVELTDREPSEGRASRRHPVEFYSWSCDTGRAFSDRNSLPVKIWNLTQLLRGEMYRSAEDAHRDASAACLAWAKGVSGSRPPPRFSGDAPSPS